MKRRSIFAGCSPHAMSVLGGAMAGALSLGMSGQGLTFVGILCLVGGYVAGAVVAYYAVMGLARVVGKWWYD